MTSWAVLAGSLGLLAGYSLAAWRAAERRLTECHLNYQRQLGELQALIVKLSSRESKPEQVVKALGDQVKGIQASFNETLTKIMVGYERQGGGNIATPPAELEYGNLDNTFNVEEARQWLPQHELVDSNMWPDGLPPLKETPDGPGGWVE